MILYQFNRAKQLQFSCKLNQLLNNSGVKGLIDESVIPIFFVDDVGFRVKEMFSIELHGFCKYTKLRHRKSNLLQNMLS